LAARTTARRTWRKTIDLIRHGSNELSADASAGGSEAIRNLKARYAALCDNQYDADGIASLFTETRWESPRWAGSKVASDPEFLPGSVGHLLLRDPLQPEWPHRGGRRYRREPAGICHAVHGGRRKSSGVAPGIDHEHVRPVDGTWMFRHKRSEPLMSVRSRRVGQDPFRVTGGVRGSVIDERASLMTYPLEPDRLKNRRTRQMRAAHINPPEFKHAADMEWKWDDLVMSPNSCFTRDRNVRRSQCGISQICAGRVLSAAPHDFAQSGTSSRRIHVCGKLYAPVR